MPLPSEAYSTHVRVRYAETDQMGIVYHANYLIWMEVGRIDACRARGFEYREMENEEGILLAVTEATCRYVSPALYDDDVEIRTVIARANARGVTFTYDLFRGEKRLATGETKHIFLNRELRPTRLPKRYFDLFAIE